ncbi:TMEM175 family protein [Micromonospora sp. RTP1Z1]|uniref:TMEM175 family protein n=1 Tax=Micromonospora sp. RTP1Z1 TaxID=2994043 RepID=UPI0029C763FD|nr:TMEM175 family protein [Micromonospora sp. RTP1Z1]
MNETGRVEAFSDGVLAIAITLLVLELPVPRRDVGSLGHALVEEWPSFAAYVTSFLVIGIIWINHRAVFRSIGRMDRTLLFGNLVLLLFVATIPFTTALFAEHLTEGGGNARTAAVCYSAVMLGMALAFTALHARATRHPGLLAEGVDAVAARRTLRHFGLGVVVYSLTVVIALVSAVACLAVHFALALYYSFEQTRGLAPDRG